MKSPFFWSVAAGLSFTAVYAAFCEEMYRDVSGRYAPMARAFVEGDFSMAFDKDYSTLAPIAGGVVSTLTGLDPYAGLIVATGLFYVLAVFPLHHLLRITLDDERLAGWGCLLYILAPKMIRISCMGCLESSRNFMLISALACLFSYFLRERRLWKAALFGLSLAGLCMTRSESVAYVPFFFLAFLVLHWSSENFAGSAAVLKKAVVPLAVSLGCLLLGILPRLIQLAIQTGTPALDRKQAFFAMHLLGAKGYEDLSKINTTIDAGQRVHGLFSLDRLWQWLDCLVNGCHLPYLLLAVVGIVLLVMAKRFRVEHWLLVCAAGWTALLYLLLNLSPRYFNVNVLLLAPFTVFALQKILLAIPERRRALFWLAAGMIAVCQIFNGADKAFARGEKDWKAAGLWLKANGGKFVEGKFSVASSDSAVNYWAESQQIMLNKRATCLDANAKGADFVLVKRKRKALIEEMSKDQEFKLVDWPGDATLAIFVRKKP